DLAATIAVQRNVGEGWQSHGQFQVRSPPVFEEQIGNTLESRREILMFRTIGPNLAPALGLPLAFVLCALLCLPHLTTYFQAPATAAAAAPAAAAAATTTAATKAAADVDAAKVEAAKVAEASPAVRSGTRKSRLMANLVSAVELSLIVLYLITHAFMSIAGLILAVITLFLPLLFLFPSLCRLGGGLPSSENQTVPAPAVVPGVVVAPAVVPAKSPGVVVAKATELAAKETVASPREKKRIELQERGEKLSKYHQDQLRWCNPNSAFESTEEGGVQQHWNDSLELVLCSLATAVAKVPLFMLSWLYYAASMVYFQSFVVFPTGVQMLFLSTGEGATPSQDKEAPKSASSLVGRACRLLYMAVLGVFLSTFRRPHKYICQMQMIHTYPPVLAYCAAAHHLGQDVQPTNLVGASDGQLRGVAHFLQPSALGPDACGLGAAACPAA
ncbi:unnamed protein product, partial [Polarella glacialis]